MRPLTGFARLGLVLRLVLCGTVTLAFHSHARTSEKAKLTVLLSSDKSEYSLTEKIRWDVRLLNSGTEPLTVFGRLRWGYAAGLTIHVTDTTGLDVPTSFLDDDVALPKELEARDSFVVLAPGHYLGTSARVDPVTSIVKSAGTYFIYVEYHTMIPKKSGKGPNFWSAEEPVIYSSKIAIHVKDK